MCLLCLRSPVYDVSGLYTFLTERLRNLNPEGETYLLSFDHLGG